MITASTFLIILLLPLPYFFQDAWWVEILIFLLVLSLFSMVFIANRQIRNLSEQHLDLEASNTNLRNEMTTLKATNKQIRDSLAEYRFLVDHLDAFVFNVNIQTDTWLTTDQLDGIQAFENKIHPEDKVNFYKRKEKWLAGQAVRFEFRTVEASGEICWNELRTESTFNESGELERVTGIIIDTTARKVKEENLAQMAFYDTLTELPNRLMLKSHLNKVLSRAKRTKHEFVIMFLDLDGFKAVNDTLGHETGDALLKDVATRLNACVREEDLVSRIGGDEFIIVFEETSKDTVEEIADRIIVNIANPYYISEKEARVTPSIGISIYPEHGTDIDSIIDHADKAMYVAKSKGKNRYQFYDLELEEYPQPKETFIAKFRKLFQK